MSTPFSISSYNTGWAMDDEGSKEWLDKWQSQHYQDHQNIYSALQSLQDAVSSTQFALSFSQLGFDPDQTESVNEFMMSNRFQHSLFYQWLNDLGKYLSKFNVPPVVVYPKVNITGPILEANNDMWSKFLEAEQQVHTLTMSGINQVYAAYETAGQTITQVGPQG
jgi:hypothetical protein